MTPPFQGTTANIRINLIMSESRVIGLHRRHWRTDRRTDGRLTIAIPRQHYVHRAVKKLQAIYLTLYKSSSQFRRLRQNTIPNYKNVINFFQAHQPHHAWKIQPLTTSHLHCLSHILLNSNCTPNRIPTTQIAPSKSPNHIALTMFPTRLHSSNCAIHTNFNLSHLSYFCKCCRRWMDLEDVRIVGCPLSVAAQVVLVQRI